MIMTEIVYQQGIIGKTFHSSIDIKGVEVKLFGVQTDCSLISLVVAIFSLVFSL